MAESARMLRMRGVPRLLLWSPLSAELLCRLADIWHSATGHSTEDLGIISYSQLNVQ